MHFGKKRPNLNPAVCDEIEALRLAMEVLSGQRVRIEFLDCNTRRGQLLLEPSDLFILWFAVEPEHRLGEFRCLTARLPNMARQRIVGHFDNYNRVSVMWLTDNLVTIADTWWVGSSMVDRTEVPLSSRYAQAYTGLIGLPDEEFLRREISL